MDGTRAGGGTWPLRGMLAGGFGAAALVACLSSEAHAVPHTTGATFTVLACEGVLSQPSIVVERLPDRKRLVTSPLRRIAATWTGTAALSPGYYEARLTEKRCNARIRFAAIDGLMRTLIIDPIASRQSDRSETGGIVALLPLAGLRVVVSPNAEASPQPVWLPIEKRRAIADSLTPGSYRLSVRFSNCCGFSRDVEVRADRLTIVQFAMEEFYQQTFAARTKDPRVGGLTFAIDGTMWFVEYMGIETRVAHLDAQSALHEFPILGAPWGISGVAPQRDGSAWILGTYGTLARLLPSGQVEPFSKIGSNVMAQSTISSDGAAWILEPFRDLTAHRFDAAGMVQSFPIGDPGEQIGFPAADDRAGLWFSEYHSNRLIHVERDGAVTKLDIPWPCGPNALIWWKSRLIFTCWQGDVALGTVDSDKRFERISGLQSHVTTAPVVDDAGTLWADDRAGRLNSVDAAFKVTEHTIPGERHEFNGIVNAGDGVIVADLATKKYFRVRAIGPVVELDFGFEPSRGDEWTRSPAGDLWFQPFRHNEFLRIKGGGIAQRIPITPAAAKMP